jgi:hypothetical protein
LRRHAVDQHADYPAIKRILSENTSEISLRRAFAKFRNDGIVETNKANSTSMTHPILEKIRNSEQQSQVVHCRICLGSYSKAYFYRHKKQCVEVNLNESVITRPSYVPATLLALHKDDEFLNILRSFHDNVVGQICRSDNTIMLVGRHLWQKDRTKVDKSDEVRKSVMADMRNLACLYDEFRKNVSFSSSDSIDMFKRENWLVLRDAIVTLTTRDTTDCSTLESNVKYGLKNAFYYILLKSADIIQGNALTTPGSKGISTVEEIKHFVLLLKHNQNAVFGDAKYLINKSRQERLRKPDRIPPEETLKDLREHTLGRIKSLTQLDIAAGHCGRSEYVELRNLICSRLTLFNARRGGEPARLKVHQWETRHDWIDKSAIAQLDEREKEIFKKMDIIYGTGKGNHLVSCMIPNDCKAGINILVTKSVREMVGILTENQFIFPNLNSEHHLGGWDATNTVSKQAGLDSSLLNATNQRGRMSTIYAGLDVAAEDRKFFYSHMGHSAQVNAGTYQRPLPILAMTKVGTYLSAIDQPSTSTCQGLFDNTILIKY